MSRLNREGRTVLIASHDPLVFESTEVNRVIELRDGKVLAAGTNP
jgi:putative ABC transport system ATP-binding protein